MYMSMREYIYQSNLNPSYDRMGNRLEEIVRCGDCKYPSSFDGYEDAWCGRNMRGVKPWNYCSWGERKEN